MGNATIVKVISNIKLLMKFSNKISNWFTFYRGDQWTNLNINDCG